MDHTTEQLIVTRYAAGTVPRIISEETGYSKTQIHRVLRKAGITRSIAEAKRILALDQTFFEKIDTVTKAQILGFIGADGCVRSTGSAIAVAIAAEDISYLEFIKNATGYGGTIKIRPSRKNNEQDLASLILCSVKMVQDISLLGCGPRKSLTLQFPTEKQVPKHLWPPYMLGYFEGDGSLSETIRTGRREGYADFVFTICGTELFCSRYATILHENLGVYASVMPQGKIFTIRINGNRQIKRVMDWLYSQSQYTLPRKRAAYQRLCEALDQSEADAATRRVAVLAKVSHSPAKNNNTRVTHLCREGVVYRIRGISRFQAMEKLWVSKRCWEMLRGGPEYKGWMLASPEAITSAEATGTTNLTYAD